MIPVRAAMALFFYSTVVAFGDPASPEALIEAGHWKKARAIVEARLRGEPNDPAANFFLSQIRNAFGDRESPLPLAEKAVALDASTAKYHRQVAEVLGIMAEHAGVFQQLLLARRFRKEIDTALSLDPRDIQALRDLMEYYLLAPGIAGGDAGKAAAVATSIAALNATEGFLAQARLAVFHKQTSKVEGFYRKAVEAEPGNYRARIVWAQYDLASDQPNSESAERQAREALALDRGRVEAYGILAATYADREAWNELDSILAAVAKEVPDDAAPYYRAAERLLASGRDPQRAERYLRTYLGREPEGNQPTIAEAHWKLGLALEAEGHAADATAEWKEAVRLDPTSPATRELKRAKAKIPPAGAAFQSHPH